MSLAARDEGILRCFAGVEQYAFRTADVRHVARPGPLPLRAHEIYEALRDAA